MKLSTYAKRLGITYQGALYQYYKGQIAGAYQLPTGTIVIPDDVFEKLQGKSPTAKPEHTIVYARVSSSENKDNLNSQAQRVESFCAAKGWVVHSVVKECASGLNDNRPKLIKILTERKATRIVVEHKDRLTRFGFNYIKTLLTDCEIVVINETAETEDLFEDFVSLVTSFSARIYGRRRSKRKTEALIKSLNEEGDSDDIDATTFDSEESS